MKKTFKFPIKKDPYYERESKRYKNPIPSREYIMQCMKKIERPLNFRELGKIFGLSLKEVEALRFRLGAMRRDGQVILNRKGSFVLVDETFLKRGIVEGHRDGYGFLIPEDSIFLSANTGQFFIMIECWLEL